VTRSTVWRTWALLRDDPPRPVAELLRTLGANGASLVARPAAALAWAEGRAVIACSEPEWLAERVHQKGRLTALTAAPPAMLSDLDGAVFTGGIHNFEVRCTGERGHGSYASRLLQIRPAGVLAPGAFRDHGILAREARAPALFLDPIELKASGDEELDRLLRAAEQMRDAAEILPPTRPAPEGSYWAPDLRAAREQLAEALGLDGATCPALAAAWRALGAPALHDLLLDGAHLTFEAEEGRPTRLMLHVPDGGGAARMRSELLFDRHGDADPALRDLVRALRADVRAALPPNTAVRRGGRRVGWQADTEVRAGTRPAASQGSTQWLEAWRHRTPEGSVVRGELDRVLRQGRRYDPPDHDGATRLLCERLIRCPSGDPSMTEPWRWSVEDFLRGELTDRDGRWKRPQELVAGWRGPGTERMWPRLCSKEGAPFVLEHKLVDAGRRRAWAWCLPLGTILRPTATIHLDDPRSPLDEACLI